MALQLQFNILTLNIWGIPFISSDRHIRIPAIVNELIKGAYDFVSLQEVWSESDYKYIKEKTSVVFPYTYYFYSGVFGSGLCLLSKYPIISTFFHAWSVNGYVHRIQHADWFGGKGIGLCRILVDDKIINIYVAHLHAEYDENDDYKTHRIIQAFDTAQFIKNTRENAVLQILAGDLNTEPTDLSYKILIHSSDMIDCCDKENVGTSDCKRNSYSNPIQTNRNPVGKRIDHILVRSGDNYDVKISNYDLPLLERIPGHPFSFSDHEGVSTKLTITQKLNSTQKSAIANVMYYNVRADGCEVKESPTVVALRECIKNCNANLEKLKTDSKMYFFTALLLAGLLLNIMDIVPTYGLKMLYLVLKFILSAIILYCLFMATLWNWMERHGVLSGKLSMEIALNFLEKYN